MLRDSEVRILIDFVPRTDREKLAHVLVALTIGLGLKCTQIRALRPHQVSVSGGYVMMKDFILLPEWVWNAVRWYAEIAPVSLSPPPYFIRETLVINSLHNIVEAHTERLLGRPVPVLHLRLLHHAQ